MTWHAEHTFGRQNPGRCPERIIRVMASTAGGFIIEPNHRVYCRWLSARMILFPENPLRFNITDRQDPLEMARFAGDPQVGVVRHFFIMRGVTLTAIT